MTRFFIIGALNVALLLGASPAMALAERAPASLMVADWLGQMLDDLERWFGGEPALATMDQDMDEDLPPKDGDGTLGDQVVPRR